ncbi:ABC transporter substrate-binding protein [Tabrizicola sp.]|uniref:ABC transporter substrate-binding protein n=1 Tax=Tabrizicola sp. TaxID=2005166 RepID=UPI002FDED060
MKKHLHYSALLAGISLSTILALPAAAACLKVIGTEGGGTSLTMDPAFNNLNDDSYQQNLVFNKLVNLDANFQPVPELAKSWSASEDGKTWTFVLEEGVTFHDGKPLTAADVVYTFKRLIDPATGSPGTPLLSFLDPAGIVAVDDHTVTMTTKDVVAELPLLIANKYTMIVQDGATSETLKAKGVGTGPFVQDVYDLAQDTRIFRKNPTYWRAGLPVAECIDLKVITEEVSRVAAIQSGSADLILSAGPAALTTLKDDPTAQPVPAAGAGGYMTLSMQTDAPPFDDLRVRQAMKLVVDRQLVVDTVLLGNGIAGNDNPIAPNNPLAYRSDTLPRDVERAKALLAEAGYPDGITVDLNTADAGPGYVMLAQVYQQMAAPAGITVNVVNNPADSYWDLIWMKSPFFSSSWNGRSVPEALAYTFISSAEYNEGRWSNAEYDALVTAMRIETDTEKRVEMVKRAQQILSEEGGIIIPVFFVDTAVLRTGCSGYVPHPSAAIYNFETLTCTQ